MRSLKVDNDDGTINWDRRAKIIAILGRLGDMSLEETLNVATNAPDHVREHVKKIWEDLDRKHKDD